jgi:hypothetical protein
MRKASGVFTLLLLSLLAWPAAHAENLGPGGGTRVIAGDQVFGPYRLYITSSPEPAVVGSVTFVVRVSDTASDQKLRDAAVTVTLAHSVSGATLQSRATHEDAGNSIDYAAHILISEAGAWDGLIRVEGPAGAVETPFLLRVSPERRLATLIAVGLPFLVILAFLGGLWVVRSRRQPRPQTHESARNGFKGT